MRTKLMKVLSAVGAVVVAVVVALLSTQGGGDESAKSIATSGAAATTANASTSPGRIPPPDAVVVSKAAGVPDRAYETLEEIDAGRWPDSANAPGTKGGVTFRNREGRLPATDESGQRAEYQEWDVNPKKKGQSRDAERIVTGGDGTAWYTADHYDSFTRMR